YLIILAVLSIAFGITSCKKDDNNSIIVYVKADDTNVKQSAFGNGQGQVVDNIIQQAYSSGTISQRYCGVLSSPTVVHDTINKTIDVDFGPGILGMDSVTRKGLISANYTVDIFTPGSELTIQFDGYSVNGKKLEGTRKLTNGGLNNNGNMYWNVQETDMKITALDSVTTREWSSTRVREMIAGQNTPEDVNDDIFKINGTATGSFSNGSTFTAVINNLIRESSCLWISSGTIDAVVQRPQDANVYNYGFDYGSGTCDNKVRLTYPDGRYEDLEL
ncbi:MAG: hypothetical protein ACKOGP_09960, partial [Bacteroidota bacterium]